MSTTEDQKSHLVRAARSKGSYGTLVKAPTLGGSLLPTTGVRVSDKDEHGKSDDHGAGA